MNCLKPSLIYYNEHSNQFWKNIENFKTEMNLSTKKIIDGNNKKWLVVPCNECINCSINKKYDLRNRAKNEFQKWKYCYFVTLTYDYYHNPFVLLKKHIQNFLKYLKKYMEFSYILSAEYGEQTNRPHYHLLIYTNKKLSKDLMLANGYFSNDLIKKCWLNRGFVSLCYADEHAINYLTTYTLKSDLKRQNKLIKQMINLKLKKIRADHQLNGLQKYIAIDNCLSYYLSLINNWPPFILYSKKFGFVDDVDHYKNMPLYQLKKWHDKLYNNDSYKLTNMFNFVEHVRPQLLHLKYINTAFNKKLFMSNKNPFQL